MAREVESTHELPDRYAARISEMLDRIGWPDESKVGPQGSYSAWVLVQHADEIELQKRGLELMQRAAGHVSKRHLAYLTDRVAVAQGLPQTYGTEYTCLNGSFVFATPIADQAHFRERRRAVGLGPADYFDSRFVKQACGSPVDRNTP